MRNWTRHTVIFAAQLLLFSFLSAPPALAAPLLDGRNITTAFYFPDQSTIAFGGDPVETTVGPGIEIAASPPTFPIASIDFSDTFIELDFSQNLTGSVATFNGWRFYDATSTLPAFTNAILTTSNTTGWAVSFDADNIWLNGSGSSYTEDSTLRIDISVVPEPISSTLFIIGGAVLGIRRWRKKRELTLN